MNKIILDKTEKGIDILKNQELDLLIVKINTKLTIDIVNKCNESINRKGVIAIVSTDENFDSNKQLLNIEEKTNGGGIFIFENSKNILYTRNEELNELLNVNNLLDEIDMLINETVLGGVLNLLEVKNEKYFNNYVVFTDDENYYKKSSLLFKFINCNFNSIEITK